MLEVAAQVVPSPEIETAQDQEAMFVRWKLLVPQNPSLYPVLLLLTRERYLLMELLADLAHFHLWKVLSKQDPDHHSTQCRG